MSIIKSYAVGFGDMYYVEHNSDNLTIIDCFLHNENSAKILGELRPLAAAKGVTRFISSHPDNDHLQGIELLDDAGLFGNFYCVKNNATKEESTPSFDRYCALRDSADAFYISKNCKRKWMNLSDDSRGASGISVLWPDTSNAHFHNALVEAELGLSPNNMSAIIKYALEGGVQAVWFGDLHKDFMEEVEDELDTSPVDIVFAPHHGRRTGRIPNSILEKMTPKIVVIGEAATEHLDYYRGYNTITQNSAGDITFDCVQGKVHIFTSKPYAAPYLTNECKTLDGQHYIGTLQVSP